MTAEVEIWAEIPGAVGFYEASSLGRIRSVDRVVMRPNRWGFVSAFKFSGVVLRPHVGPNGYQAVTLKVEAGRWTESVHRLVCLAFHGDPPDRHDVNHIDGCKTNNRASNLEWCSHRENMQHARQAGLLPTRRAYIGVPKAGGPEVHFANEDEAARFVGAPKRGNTCSAASGRLKSAYGYLWRYADPQPQAA